MLLVFVLMDLFVPKMDIEENVPFHKLESEGWLIK